MRNTILKLTHNTAWYTFVNVAKLLTYIASVALVMEVAERVNSEHGVTIVIAAVAIAIGYAFYGCYVFGKLRREREIAEEQRMMERLSN